jgi:hypothetical protein
MFVQETDSKLKIRDLIDPVIYGVENTDNIILERHVEWKKSYNKLFLSCTLSIVRRTLH